MALFKVPIGPHMYVLQADSVEIVQQEVEAYYISLSKTLSPIEEITEEEMEQMKKDMPVSSEPLPPGTMLQ